MATIRYYPYKKKGLTKVYLRLKVGRTKDIRQSTLLKAEELEIKGFVMNLNDNSVYIEAECESKLNMDVFISWCKEGPEHAIVEKIEKVKSFKKDYNNFQIVY